MAESVPNQMQKVWFVLFNFFFKTILSF